MVTGCSLVPIQTLFHWLSIIVSVLLYFVFALIYNGACVDCLDLNNIPFWVMQHSMGTIQGRSSIGEVLALHYLNKSVCIQLGYCNIPFTTHMSHRGLNLFLFMRSMH